MIVPPRRYWQTDAFFSPCGLYRYQLSRTWGDKRRILAVVSLNPSTADAYDDDPTVRRDIDFAQRWGFDGLIKLNLFAYRSTEPLRLLDVEDPVGQDNDRILRDSVSTVARTVMAWGSHKKSKALRELVAKRAAVVSELLRTQAKELGHLGLNEDGAPKHPLYLAKETAFISVKNA
jgi:hypothetical protein